MLKEIVENGYYSFADEFDNWRDAIRKSYQPLLEENIVEPIYIDSVIQCVEKYGPYIVIVPNIAMPHSTEGAQGCHGTAISFMHVNKPVDFDSFDPDKKAKLFFSLAAVDHEKHLENIQALMDVLMNEELVDELLKAESKADLEKIASQYEGENV